MLERFYTDICSDVGIGRILGAGRNLPFIGNRLTAIASRKLPPEIKEKTTAFGHHALRSLIASHLRSLPPEQAFRNAVKESLGAGRKMTRHGFGTATHLYMMLDEYPTLMRAAKDQGIKVVSDVYILISTEKLLAKERKLFPDWEPTTPDLQSIRRPYGIENSLFELADFFLCPSTAVQDDLVANWGIKRGQTAYLPFAVTDQWHGLSNIPKPRQILFVGTADLRKGIHYFAMAAEILRSRRVRYEFRVAGNVKEQIRRHPTCRHLTFLGRVPRSEIQKEFAQADVLVLPSLAEGAAGVTFEALASGVPQIVTIASGSVARDGIDGITVRERDPEGLADGIEQIVENRELRTKMAIASKTRASEFSWEAYQQRLVTILKTMKL